ncbi:hypothetical protein [Acaryochloris sp. IP29b_bin.137]
MAKAVASSICPHWLPMFQVPMPIAETCRLVLPSFRYSIIVNP